MLKCIDKAHYDLYEQRADAILKHFEPEYYQQHLTEVAPSQIKQLKDDLRVQRDKLSEFSQINIKVIAGNVTEAQTIANQEMEAANEVE